MWNPNPPPLPPPSSNNNSSKKNVSVTIRTPTRGIATSNKGGKPPPVPTTTTTDASPFRPQRQEQELEALRQRGLAKLLNKHFHEQSQKLAKEKAAVDCALRDLEERKQRAALQARPTNNTPTRTQVEDMYHKMSVRKAECQQKERETLLLYQRYVHKFGPSGQVKAPAAENNNKAAVDATGQQQPQVTNTPSPSASSLVAEDDSPEKQARPTTTTTTTMMKQLSEIGDSSRPMWVPEDDEDEASNNQNKKDSSSSPLFHPTASMTAKEPSHQVVLGETNDTGVAQEEEKELNLDDSGVLLSHYLETNNQKEQAANTTAANTTDDDDDEDELSSLISGLTSVDSATTRQILLDCELTVATFLEEERRAVQAMLDQDVLSRSSSRGSVSGGAKHVDGAASLPSLRGTPSSGQHNKSSSNRSVGTHPILSSKNVVQEEQERRLRENLQTNAALEAETMAEQMQKILQDFELAQTTGTTTNGGASPTSSLDTLTVATSTTEHSKEDFSPTQQQQQQQPQGRPYPTSNPNQEWVVLYDDTYQREYYHETRSNTTQWHPPSMDDGGKRNNVALLDPSDVRPASSSMTSDRIQKYRAKRRRRRRKKIVRALAAAVVVACASAGGYYYYKQHQPATGVVEERAQDSAAAAPTVVEKETTKRGPAQVSESASSKTRMMMTTTPSLATTRSTTTTKPLQMMMTMNSNKKDEEETRSTRADDDSVKKKAVPPKTDETEAPKKKETTPEPVHHRETTTPSSPSPSPTVLSSYHARFSNEDDTSHNAQHQIVVKPKRPWSCNLPLAYLGNRKCWTLASDHPPFDCQALVDAMLQ